MKAGGARRVLRGLAEWVGPWLVAAVAACLATLAALWLYTAFLEEPSGSCRGYRIDVSFGMADPPDLSSPEWRAARALARLCFGRAIVVRGFSVYVLDPLDARSRLLVAVSSLVFWAIGELIVVRALSRTSSWREFTSRGLRELAIGVGCYVIPSLFTVWTLAFVGGHVSFDGWEGRHGPWWSLRNLNALLGDTLLLPTWVVALGVLAAALDRERATWLVPAGGVVLLWVLVATHLWLID